MNKVHNDAFNLFPMRCYYEDIATLYLAKMLYLFDCIGGRSLDFYGKALGA